MRSGLIMIITFVLLSGLVVASVLDATSKGSIIVEDGNVYVLFDEDARTDEGVELIFDEQQRSDLSFSEEIVFSQRLTVINERDDAFETRINLWNLDVVPSAVFVFRISRDDEIISEAPIIILHLEQGESVELLVEYITPPIERDIVCTTIMLRDLIPYDARIISADVPLDMVVEESCTLTLSHPIIDDFSGLEVDISSIDVARVRSVVHVESGESVQVAGALLRIP